MPRSRRRANGEGSVCRRADGRWVATLSVGRDARGRLVRRAVYGRTRQEAHAKLLRLQHAALDGRPVLSNRALLADYLERWLEEARPSLARSTHRHYGSAIRAHVAPLLGGVRLDRLEPRHVQTLHAEMERRGASPATQIKVRAVLRRALGQAVRYGLLPANPCDGVPRPRLPRKEVAYLDAGQVRRLFDAARGDPLEALVVLAVTTGLRQGELLGLQWRDVDLEARTLAVRRQLLEHSDGSLELGELKTRASRRRVDLPGTSVRALEAHRSRAKVASPDGLVFTDSRGGPVRKGNLLRRWFRPLLKRAGLPPVRFHDLRHTHATLLLAQGAHPKVVQERLGHSQISMTLDVYSHAVPSMQREAARGLDDLLDKG